MYRQGVGTEHVRAGCRSRVGIGRMYEQSMYMHGVGAEYVYAGCIF